MRIRYRVALRPIALVSVLLLAAGALTACGPAISKFNETAYEQATALKVESLALMESATEPYPKHADDVRDLRERLEKAHEYAKGRPNNEISTEQWSILLDPEGNLLGGFLRRWRDSTTMNDSLVSLKQDQIGKAFDTIIELESGKLSPEEVQGQQ